MKKYITILSVLIIPATLAFAQDYQVFEKKSGGWTKIQNGTTINRACVISSDGVNETFAVKNASGSQRATWSRKIKQYQVDKADNSFCWNGCMPPWQYLSSKSLPMKPDSLYDRQFEVHFIPGNVSGNTLITYSFFDRDHLADSSWFSILYVTQLTDVNEQDIRLKRMTAQPNPARSLVRFTGIPSGFNGRLVIVNMLGSRMAAINIMEQTTPLESDMSTFPDGVYFYYLESDQGKGAAAKLIIQR